jgi:hypothetical protein
MQSLPRGTSSVKRRLKLVLPIVMGLISAVLMVWDIHNQNIIRLMAMRWDTGAPLWPYQTPDTLLYAMNLPAYYVGGASAYYFDVGLIGPLATRRSSPLFSPGGGLRDGISINVRMVKRQQSEVPPGPSFFAYSLSC